MPDTIPTREILSRIRHQIFTPEVTTMGNCPDCGHGSRGAQRCAVCIVDKELAPMVGAYLANEYHAACKRQRAVELRILAMAGDRDG